jgi:hypothetical protein
LFYPFSTAKAQITAASCNSSDVQAAINQATAGQTVSIPAGTCSWSSGVSISGKTITLTGAGSGRIIAYSTSALTLGAGSKTAAILPDNASGATPSITAGETLRISELGFRANFMEGTVTSYSSSTGALSMNVTSSGGSCGTPGPANTMNSNCKRWLISTIPNTVIINNSSSALIKLTESTSGHINVGNFKIAVGTGANDFYLTRATNGHAILLHDLWLETNGNIGGTLVDGNTSRGVLWNASVDSSPFGASNTQAFRTKDANGTAMGNSWKTASTMGTADSTGENNFYVEDSDFHAFMGLFDLDDNSRTVIRYNFFNNAGGSSHGADTSNYGLRHFEYYNNVGVFQAFGDGSTANVANGWILVRGGTHAIHDNVLAQISSQDWGTKPDIDYALENLARNGGPHACWGNGASGGHYYYAPRQIGTGYVTGGGGTAGPQVNCSGTGCTSSTSFSGSSDGFSYVGDSEPAYLWNNKRTVGGTNTALNIGYATPYTDCSGADLQSNYIVSGRDFFDSASTAKPGYSPYAYPHPLRTGGTQSSTPPAPPTGLTAVVN